MGLLPRGFVKGLLVGGSLAALWWILCDRRRREITIDTVMEKTGTVPFPGSRLYGLLAEQMMGGIYRAVAEDVVAEARSGELLGIDGGAGQLAVELGSRARDLKVTAMDTSAGMVRLAESRIHAAGLGRQVKVALGGANDIAFPDNSFDYILSLGSLHRWRAPDLALEEIYRVLKPGSKAWIYDIRRELTEEDWERIRQRVPALVRPFFELGTVASWRAAFTENQVRDVVASSPFLQAEIEPLAVEIVGVRFPGLTKITVEKSE